MKIHKKLIENIETSLALGFFDGIHVAHKKLIEKTVNYAQKNNLKSSVITFKEHPLTIIKGYNIKYLITLDEKIKIFEKYGIDELFILDFADFKDTEPKNYLGLLKNTLNPKYIVTGFNHTFGKGGLGNSKYLKENQEKFNFKYEEISPIYINNELVSTTNIKKLLDDGKIKQANEMLGRNFKIEGMVKFGAKLGRELGFKTANIRWNNEIYKLPYGVYKGLVLGKSSLINFGTRPTVDGATEVVEAHIKDFEGDLYGKNIEIEFLSKIRDEIKFNSIDELRAQIQKVVERL